MPKSIARTSSTSTACSTSKSFGPMKNGTLAAPGRCTLYGMKLRVRLFGSFGHRQRHRLVVDACTLCVPGSATLRKY